jgi:hypothetical protein
MVEGDRSHGVRAERLLGVLLAKTVPWAAAAALVCTAAYLVLGGVSAGVGALVGVALVTFFFGVDVVVLRLTRSAPPPVTVGALFADYLLKVVLLAALLWGVSTSTDLDMQAVAVTVVVITLVGAGAATTAAIRTKSFYFDYPST